MISGKVISVSGKAFKVQIKDKVEKFYSDNSRNLILYSEVNFVQTDCIVTSLENIKGEVLRELINSFCLQKHIKNKDGLYNTLIQSSNWETKSGFDSVIELTLLELNEYNSCTSLIKNKITREAVRNNIFQFLFKSLCTSFCSLIGIPYVKKPKRFVKIFNAVRNPLYRIKYISDDSLEKLMKIFKYNISKKQLAQRRHASFILNNLISKPGHLCLPLNRVPVSVHFANREEMLEELKKYSFSVKYDSLIENGILKKQQFINSILNDSKIRNEESTSNELIEYHKSQDEEKDEDENDESEEEEGRLHIKEFTIISGTAGSGKTTEMVSLLSEAKLVYFVLAPTGKAVQRVIELLHLKGIKFEDERISTIHRFLFKQLPSSIDLLIIDEASMISLKLFYRLLRNLHSIKSHISSLILVGDPNQLGPIERGNIFSQLINSNQFNCRFLNHNYRAEAGLSIAINQLKVLKDETDFIVDDNFVIERTTDVDKLIDLITQFVLDAKQEAHEFFKDLQIISPFKESVDNINRRIKTILFSDETNRFHIDERIICKKNLYKNEDIENDHTVMNGEQGVIIDIYPDERLPEEKKYKIKFSDDREVIFSSDEFYSKPMKCIQSSYALTIHSSQGSEWKYIIIFIPNRAVGTFINKNMIYTAMSRATHYVRIFCENIELYSIKKKSEKYSLMNRILNENN